MFKANGIDEKDIQTSSFDIFEETRGRSGNRFRVYTVSIDVTVKVRDVDSLGKVLDAVVRAGSNSVNGVTFGLQDPTKVLDEGRENAIKDAMRKAKLYADAANVRVGKVLTISETAITETREENSFGSSGQLRRGPSPQAFVSIGEVDVVVKVFVLYELLE